MAFQRSRPSLRFVIAVVAGHLLLAWLLHRAVVWRDRTAPPRDGPPLVVRLLNTAPVPRAAPADAVRRAPPAAATAARDAARPRAPAAALTVPEAAALPPPPPQAPPATAPPAPPALVLDLPRAASAPERWRNPALNDPRANSAKATVESRIAGVVGDGKLTEEALGDGRTRFHRNGDCVDVRPNTFGQIDPFNQAVRPLPKLAKAC